MYGEEKRCRSLARASHPSVGAGLDVVPYRHIPWQCLALVLLLLILSLLGPGRAGQQFTGPSVILTIIGRIYAGNKGDWSFNTSAQEK